MTPTRKFAALATLAGALAAAVALGTASDAPPSWVLDGGTPGPGEVEIACYAVNVLLPCATVLRVAPAYECVGDEDMVPLWLRAPVALADVPERAFAELRTHPVLVDSARAVPCSAPPENGKVIGFLPRATAFECLVGDVSGDGRPRGLRKCCGAGCLCRAGACSRVPDVEPAGREVWKRRLCAVQPAAPGCT